MADNPNHNYRIVGEFSTKNIQDALSHNHLIACSRALDLGSPGHGNPTPVQMQNASRIAASMLIVQAVYAAAVLMLRSADAGRTYNVITDSTDFANRTPAHDAEARDIINRMADGPPALRDPQLGFTMFYFLVHLANAPQSAVPISKLTTLVKPIDIFHVEPPMAVVAWAASLWAEIKTSGMGPSLAALDLPQLHAQLAKTAGPQCEGFILDAIGRATAKPDSPEEFVDFVNANKEQLASFIRGVNAQHHAQARSQRGYAPRPQHHPRASQGASQQHIEQRPIHEPKPAPAAVPSANPWNRTPTAAAFADAPAASTLTRFCAGCGVVHPDRAHTVASYEEREANKNKYLADKSKRYEAEAQARAQRKNV
jgi:hypothetical protein